MDKIRIKSCEKVVCKEVHTGGNGLVWRDAMTATVGKALTVELIDFRDNTAFCSSENDSMFWYRIDWLEPWEGELDGQE